MKRARRSNHQVILTESLEPRSLLSVALADEFRVNAVITGDETRGTIASDADGDFVIVWESPDLSQSGIFARRYNSSGVAQGPGFRVNTFTTQNQTNPVVAMDAAGDFVVAWESYHSGSSFEISARRYNAAGVALGGEFQVNTFTTGNQAQVTVAMDSSGEFVVSWMSYLQVNQSDIFARIYNAAGAAQGGAFRVNAFTTANQDAPSVAIDDDGNFMIAWQRQSTFGGFRDISAQRFNDVGSPVGTELRINSFTTDEQFDPSIAMDPDGNFVVSWVSQNQGGIGRSVFARRYDKSASAIGTEFRVSSTTLQGQDAPSAWMDDAGNFVIAWQGADGSGNGVFARRFNPQGTPEGNEFLVNHTTANAQQSPAVALDGDGDFIITWESRIPAAGAPFGYGYGQYGRRFGVPKVVAGKLLVPGSSGGDSIIIEKQFQNLSVTQNGTVATFASNTIQSIDIRPGSGNDLVIIGPGIIAASVLGGDGDDSLKGGDGKDSLNGAAGKDRLFGNGGADVLRGGKGNDSITGGNGNDSIFGEQGNDSLDGGNNNDQLNGGAGTDTLLGGKGNDGLTDNTDNVIDHLNGGAGSDFALAKNNDILVQIEDVR